MINEALDPNKIFKIEVSNVESAITTTDKPYTKVSGKIVGKNDELASFCVFDNSAIEVPSVGDVIEVYGKIRDTINRRVHHVVKSTGKTTTKPIRITYLNDVQPISVARVADMEASERDKQKLIGKFSNVPMKIKKMGTMKSGYIYIILIDNIGTEYFTVYTDMSDKDIKDGDEVFVSGIAEDYYDSYSSSYKRQIKGSVIKHESTGETVENRMDAQKVRIHKMIEDGKFIVCSEHQLKPLYDEYDPRLTPEDFKKAPGCIFFYGDTERDAGSEMVWIPAGKTIKDLAPDLNDFGLANGFSRPVEMFNMQGAVMFVWTESDINEDDENRWNGMVVYKNDTKAFDKASFNMKYRVSRFSPDFSK